MDAPRFEPVLVTALVTAILGTLAAFGVQISPQQNNAVQALLTAAIPLVAILAGIWARSRVTPTAKLSSPRADT